MNKLKIGLAGMAAVAMLFFIGAYFQASMREKDAALIQQKERIAQLEAENERLSNLIVNAKRSSPQPSETSRELLRLRGEVGVLRQQTNELVGLRNENIKLSRAVAAAETNQMATDDQIMVRQIRGVEAVRTLLHAIEKYVAAHNGEFPGSLDQIIASGDIGGGNLPGGFRLDDFEFGEGLGTDPGGHSAVLKLRAPNARPGGGAAMIVGKIDSAGRVTSLSVGP